MENQAPFATPCAGLARELVRLHARLTLDAAECERLSRRHGPHAAIEAEQGRELRANAAALRAIIEERFPAVAVPDPRQMSLLSDGAP